METVSVFIQGVPGYARVFLVRETENWKPKEERLATRSGNYFHWILEMKPGEGFNFVIFGERVTEEAAGEIYTLPCNQKAWGHTNQYPTRWDGQRLWLTAPHYPVRFLGQWNEHNIWPLNRPWAG